MVQRIVDFFKFLMFVVLIPLMVIATAGFNEAISALPFHGFDYFWVGVVAYLILHLFILKPRSLFDFNQKLAEDLFHFWPPLGRAAGYIIPLYSVIVLLILTAEVFFLKSDEFSRYLILLVGFTLTMHLVLAADNLRDGQEDFTQPGYLLGLVFIYLILILLTLSSLSLIFSEISFSKFSQMLIKDSWHLYRLIFHQIF